MKLKSTLAFVLFTSFIYAQNVSYVHLDSIFSALLITNLTLKKLTVLEKNIKKK